MAESIKHKFRQVKKLPWWVYIAPAGLIRFLKFIMRFEVKSSQDCINNPEPLISVTWHNRLMFFPVVFPSAVRKKTVAVVSPSRDGQYIVDLIAMFGLRSLRGSTSKRGGQVMVECLSAIKSGSNVSFTPDGPRGPKYKMSRGPIVLASLTGSPIVPVSVNASDYWQIKSWDNFQIPKPWAKLTLVVEKAIKIPADLDDEGIEKWRAIIEEKLMAITVDKN